MARNPTLVPVNDAVVGEDRRLLRSWAEYISALAQGDAESVKVAGTVNLTEQSAAISSTAVPIQTVYTALYRVSYYARITRAATSSSDLTVTLGWTESGVSLSSAGAVINGNTTTTIQTGSVLIVVDGDTDITYEAAYNSSGATSMQYRLRIVVELVEN